MHKRYTKRNSLFFKAPFEAALFQKSGAVGFGGAGAEAPKRQGVNAGAGVAGGGRAGDRVSTAAGTLRDKGQTWGAAPYPTRTSLLQCDAVESNRK